MCAGGNPAIEYLFRVKLRLFGPRCDFTVQPRPRLNYSRTSRKRPPKMHRLSGRLREMVVYKNRTIRASSEKRSGHINFMVDDLLHAVSIKLRHEQFHVVTKGLRILLVPWCTQRTQRSEDASSGRLQVVKNIGKSLILPKLSAIPPLGSSVTTDPPFCSPKNQTIRRKNKVAFAYRRWSFELLTVRFCLTGKTFGVLDWRSFTGGGRTWRFTCTQNN